MAAPRPEPTAIKIAKGNPGKRTLNHNEPKPPTGEPSMPKGLSASARKEWRSIVPELMKLGVLTVVDGKALAAYCETFALWESARKDYQKNGITFKITAVTKIKQADGSVKEEVLVLGIKRNPAVAIASEALRAMKSFLIEFGLTPASRSRLAVEKPADETDPVAAFLAKTAAQKQANADSN